MGNWDVYVDHPSHYNIPGRKECIEEMKEKYGAEITIIFCLTNAYKYLYRAGLKEGNPLEQDINKAKKYYEFSEKLIESSYNSDPQIYPALKKIFYLRKDIKDMLDKEDE